MPGRCSTLGFGFVEVGTLTPRPQAGNPKPRLFRLAEDRAVINRMGFNNDGQPAAFERLRRALSHAAGIVGVNIGANKDSADRIADYVAGVRAMSPVADYLTINISSPNTPGLRELQDEGALDELLAAVREARVGQRRSSSRSRRTSAKAIPSGSSVPPSTTGSTRSSFRTRRFRGRRFKSRYGGRGRADSRAGR